MASRLARRMLVGALVAVGLLAGCGDEAGTTTTEEIQQAAVYSDADVLSVLVAGNYDIAQVAVGAQTAFDDAASAGTVIDPGATSLVTQQASDANAALVRLYGTSEINPADGSAVEPGGLAASVAGGVVSNSQTDAQNAQASDDATAVAGSDTPDLEYAKAAVAEDQALLDFVTAALDPDSSTVKLTSDPLRAELQAEQATLTDDLAAAQAELAALDPESAASP